MASEEMDRVSAHLKRLGLAYAARNLDGCRSLAAVALLSYLVCLVQLSEESREAPTYCDTTRR